MLCAAVGTYLLRNKPEQTFLMYLTSLWKETNQPLLYRYGIKFRALFDVDPQQIDFKETISAWGRMAAAD